MTKICAICTSPVEEGPGGIFMHQNSDPRLTTPARHVKDVLAEVVELPSRVAEDAGPRIRVRPRSRERNPGKRVTS
jgi:hypothetical protein